MFIFNAVKEQEWELVRDVSRRYHRLFEAALASAECGNLEMVSANLLGCTQAQRIRLMHAACRGGRLPVMQLLLDRGVSVNHLQKDGRLPSSLSCGCPGRLHEIGCLLVNEEMAEEGGDDEDEEKGPSFLMQAARFGNAPAVEMLVGRGGNVNFAETTTGVTALMLGSEHGHLETVRVLLKAGSNVNATSTVQGDTALTYASQNGMTEVARALLEHMADVSIFTRGYNGLNALMHASNNGHLAVVNVLLELGASANASRPSNGLTAVMRAAENGHLPVVAALLDRGGDVNAVRSSDGLNSLMRACQNGQLEVAQLLLQRGASVNAATTDTHTTPLMWASERGHLEVVRLLVGQGAQVNATNKAAMTAVQLARQEGHTEVVHLLLQSGAKEEGHGATSVPDDDEDDDLVARAPIVVIREPHRTPLYLIVCKPLEIGRQCSGVLLADEDVSRRHLLLSPIAGGTVNVTDLGSTNGTTVNGQRLYAPHVLLARELVRLGKTTIQLYTGASSLRTPSESVSDRNPLLTEGEI